VKLLIIEQTYSNKISLKKNEHSSKDNLLFPILISRTFQTNHLGAKCSESTTGGIISYMAPA